MNEGYLVSVIVPVYNVEPYLRKCVDSILNQSYRKIEIILVDDGSTDMSGRICDEYSNKDERIKVIHKKNGGLSSARNAGLEIAKGDYISYIDSDDYVTSLFIEELVGLCIKYNTGISCIGYKEFSSNDEKTVTVISDECKPIIYDDISFIKEIVDSTKSGVITYCVWSKLFRRDIVEKMKFPEGKTYEDIMYTTAAIFRAKQCVFKNDKLYNYRIREGSISKSHYKEGFDVRLLTDRLELQIEQLKYLKNKEQRELVNVVKFEYYEEAFNLWRKSNSKEWESSFKETFRLFKLTNFEIMQLPYTLKRKCTGILKMRFPHLLNKILV